MKTLRSLFSVVVLLPLLSYGQWVDIPDPTITGIGETTEAYFIDDQVGFGAMQGCRIARTDDGGQSWTVVGDYDDAESNGILYDIDFDATGMYGVAIGQNGFDTDLIGMVSSDGGLSWADAPDLTALPAVSVRLEVVAPQTFLIGSFLTWALTTNGGADFTESYITSAFSLQFLDAAHVFRLGGSLFAEFSYSSDTGMTWVDHDAPGTTGYVGSSFADPLHGIAVQSLQDLPQVLMRTADGGVSWEPVLTCTSVAVRMDDQVSLAPEGNGIVIMQDDDTLHVFLSDDFGATWTEHTPDDGNIAFVQATLGGAFYIIGQNAGTNYWRYTGAVSQVPAHTAQRCWSYDGVSSTLWFTTRAPANVRLTDMGGRQVLRTTGRAGSPLHLALPPGVYLVQVEVNGEQITDRLFVP